MQVEQDALTPGVDQVGFMVRGNDYYAPDLATRQLRPLPGLGADHSDWGPVLTPSGRHLLFYRRAFIDDEALPLSERRRVRSVCRYTFASGENSELNFTPTEHPGAELSVAGSPDGAQVLVAQQDPQPNPGYDRADVTLWLGRWDGSPGTVIHAFRGAIYSGGDNLDVQWDPTGRIVAASLYNRQEADGSRRRELIVVDARSGEIVQRYPDMQLAGSSSFNTTGDKVLVVHDEHLRFIQILDLSSSRSDRLPLPHEHQQDYWRAGLPRVLGFSGSNHVVYAIQRGESMTLFRSELSGENAKAVVRWRLAPDMYPTITASFWKTLSPLLGA